MGVLLETRNLTKHYDNQKGIDDINIQVEKGDIYGFLGPNGSGKTTTIRSILRLIHKNHGQVIIDGYDLDEEFENAIINVGAIVETPKFYEYLSGRKNLKVIANYHDTISDARIDEVLDMVGLKDRQHDKVKNYSLGMKQRLGIARSLLHYPKLVILDEPTNGLDPQGMKEVREMISQLAYEKDITFLISTHLLNEVEQICNKVGILKNGRMVAQGNVKDLLAEDTETVEIVTDHLNEALKFLKTLEFIKEVTLKESNITLRMNKGRSEDLNKILIEKGIGIKYLIPKGHSLEQYFFDLMKGENKHV